MKNIQRLQWITLLVLLLSIFTACKKNNNNDPQASKFELLTAKGAKTWQIEQLSVNDTLIALTPQQLQYTRTYKSDSTFVDSDGISGKYRFLNGDIMLYENILLGGAGARYYNILSISDSKLVMRLYSDGTNKLNTMFTFHAQ
jgi:hypothetical protein